MKMQGVCQTYDYVNDYNRWESEKTPSTSNVDITKKCVMFNSGSYDWVLEKCSQQYSFICEIHLGE